MLDHDPIDELLARAASSTARGRYQRAKTELREALTPSV